MPTPHLPFLPRELHTTARPSATAQWTALGRALELSRPVAERIVSDDYAPVFLTSANHAVLATLRAGLSLVHAAERRALGGGLSAFVLCRHRFIDEQLQAALSDGAEQVLILGAGYDSRAYRFASALQGRPVHEVDLAPLSRRKAAIVAARPDLFGHTAIRRVEIDFRTQSLAERLLESGFAVGARAFVAWEGVSPYLTSSAVSATLATLSEICGAGSVLTMDYWDGVGGSGPMAPVRRLGARAIRLIGEPVTFGLRPGSVGEFLDAHGFTVTDLVQHVELAARYSTDGRPCEDSVYVVAARL
jgi:methyltransferase (TIGR00027 family)